MTDYVNRTGIISAILAINPEAKVSVNAEDYNQITWLRGTTPIANEDILAKQVELQAEYVAQQYQRDRIEEPQKGGYPSIGDQLDMQYHDLVDGTTTWKDAVEAIKDANPKP